MNTIEGLPQQLVPFSRLHLVDLRSTKCWMNPPLEQNSPSSLFSSPKLPSLLTILSNHQNL